jgi:hypothetical protein
LHKPSGGTAILTLTGNRRSASRALVAPARVDAQREKLTGQLGELEATERVIARYSKGTRHHISTTAEP